MKKFTFGFGREHSEAEQGSGCPLYTNKTYKTEGKTYYTCHSHYQMVRRGWGLFGYSKDKNKGFVQGKIKDAGNTI